MNVQRKTIAWLGPTAEERTRMAGGHTLTTPPRPQAPGPGTELTAILADWLGIESSPGCSCRSMAAKMDAMGPGWCESDAGMAEILAVMQAEHAKRREARQTILPWSDTAARTLVRIACKRARRKLAAG